MLTKAIVRVMWTLLFVAVLTGYASAVARFTGLDV
jgi:hypothetical protein